MTLIILAGRILFSSVTSVIVLLLTHHTGISSEFEAIHVNYFLKNVHFDYSTPENSKITILTKKAYKLSYLPLNHSK